MSARHFPAIDATAFRLAALLEQYEQDVEELPSTWLDTSLYERVTRDLGEMRLLCAGLPLLSVPWLHLLISHAEFLNCLWARSPDGDCKSRHLVAIRALRQKCLYQFTRVEASPGIQAIG